MEVERNRNFAELSAVFFNVKIFDEVMVFEMIKKFDNDVASVLPCRFIGAVHLALFENIIEGDSGSKLGMKFNFGDPAHNVLFERNDKGSVVLVGDVQKFVRIADNLVFKVGNIEKRAGVFEVDDVFDGLTVYFSVQNTGGQEIFKFERKMVAVFARILQFFERIGDIGKINDSAHKLGNGIENGVFLVFGRNYGNLSGFTD